MIKFILSLLIFKEYSYFQLFSNITVNEEATEMEERKDSFAIFFILFVIVLAILVVHALMITEFHHIPESLAIVLLGNIVCFINYL